MTLNAMEIMEKLSKKLEDIKCTDCRQTLTEKEVEFSKKTDEPFCDGCFRWRWVKGA